MQQRVKNVSYLAKAVIPLQTLEASSKGVVALPSGAEVISVNLEVSEANTEGVSLSVGLEGANDVFMSNVTLDSLKCEQSAVNKGIKETTSLTITPSAKPSNGSVIVRVVYFLRSEILAEF